jgi:hypothetical protein
MYVPATDPHAQSIRPTDADTDLQTQIYRPTHRPVRQGTSMDTLKFHPGLPCLTLLRPASRFWGGAPAGWAACSRLLPSWIPRTIWSSSHTHSLRDPQTGDFKILPRATQAYMSWTVSQVEVDPPQVKLTLVRLRAIRQELSVSDTKD